MSDDTRQEQFISDLDIVLSGIRSLLIDKNRKYGDSVLSPVRIFSKADITEQIRVRLDDKLSRLLSCQGDDQEDAEQDLLGYLIINEISKLRERKNNASE